MHVTIGASKVAFTLAEVLITLGIIGVVAAMTLPTIINNTKKKELRVALTKNYSVMQQALQKMAAVNGNIPVPADFGQQQFKGEYIKHFNVLLDCGLGSTDITDRVNAKLYCPSEQWLETEDNRRYTKYYKTYNKSRFINPSLLNNGQFILKDGSLIMIENMNPNILYISVDVNGVPKGPNIWGQDLFTFQFMPDGKLIPMGTPGTDHADQNTFCSRSSSNTYNGVGCTFSALTDENYWKTLP